VWLLCKLLGSLSHRISERPQVSHIPPWLGENIVDPPADIRSCFIADVGERAEKIMRFAGVSFHKDSWVERNRQFSPDDH
jgi:hypothetical protein